MMFGGDCPMNSSEEETLSTAPCVERGLWGSVFDRSRGGSREQERGFGVCQVPHSEGGTPVRLYHPPKLRSCAI